MAVAERSARQMAFPADRQGAAATRTALWWLAACLVVGAGIRFATLSQQSFWIDEAATWNVVHGSLGHAVSTVPRTESTPPLYYVILWVWSRLFGTSEAGLRSLSALCGTFAIPVAWQLGRRLYSVRVAVIAAALVAVNPLLVWFSQEARAYSLLVLMGALTLLTLVRALETPSGGRVLAWGIVCALALCTHYFAAFLVAPEAVVLGARLVRGAGQASRARLALAMAPVAAMAAALAPLAIHQNDGRARYISYYSGSLGYRFAQLGKEDIIGYGQPAKIALTLIGGVLVLAALGWLWRAAGTERSRGLLLAGIGGGGVLLALLVSALATDYFNTRNLLATWPALGLVVAAGLGAARRAWLSAAATLGLVALSLFCVANVIREPTLQRDDWRGAVDAAGVARGPRAVVSDSQSPVTLKPYLTGLGRFPAAGATVREVDLLWLRRRQWGRVTALTPRPLPGFSTREIRGTTFIVVRYLAPRPTVVQPAPLARLFPDAPLATVLLQRGSPPSR